MTGVGAALASARGAVEARSTPNAASLGLPVRMGIATGEAEQRADDYFGPALNRAARVMAVGHGGQILVSASAVGSSTASSWLIWASTVYGICLVSSICSKFVPTVSRRSSRP